MENDNQWTITYKSNTQNHLIGQKICLENAGQIENRCQIIFLNKKTTFIYFEKVSFDFEKNKFLQKECINVLSEDIADIVAWRYNLSISNMKVRKGNIYKIKTANNYILSDKRYRNFLLGNYSEEVKKILEAYREIKNEANEALRFLMSYRLVEVLAKKNRKNTNSFIESIFPKIGKVQTKRNKIETDIVSYARGKIHATDNKYKFPYEALKGNAKSADDVLRGAIRKEILIKNKY